MGSDSIDFTPEMVSVSLRPSSVHQDASSRRKDYPTGCSLGMITFINDKWDQGYYPGRLMRCRQN